LHCRKEEKTKRNNQIPIFCLYSNNRKRNHAENYQSQFARTLGRTFSAVILLQKEEVSSLNKERVFSLRARFSMFFMLTLVYKVSLHIFL